MLLAGEATSSQHGKTLHTQEINQGTTRKTQELIPQSTSYLVHAAGTEARDQTCHTARLLVKILLVPVELTS